MLLGDLFCDFMGVRCRDSSVLRLACGFSEGILNEFLDLKARCNLNFFDQIS